MGVDITKTENNIITIDDGENQVGIIGSGFVYNDQGKKHYLDLVVVVLNQDSTAEEDRNNVKVYQTSKNDITDSFYPVKIEAYSTAQPGRRTIIVKDRSVQLVEGRRCPNDSPACDSLEGGILIYKTPVPG